MKNLALIVGLIISSFHCCFSQLVLTKNNRTISLDKNRVWDIQTNSVLLLSFFDYKYYAKKKKYKDYKLFQLDTVKNIRKIGDTLELATIIVEHYRDTVSGEIYSNTQIEKESNRRKYRNQRVLKDTTFNFAISDIRQLKVQTRQYRHGDEMGIFGMFVMGAGVIVYSIVTVLKGNSNGYYGLALGSGMLILARHWVKQAKWLEEFKTSKTEWTIKSQ